MKVVGRRFLILLALCLGVLPILAAAGYKLAIAPAGNRVLISWPVAATNYVLQSTISLSSPNWLTVVNPAPVIANNTNTVTYTNNSLTRFFRLFLGSTGYYLSIARSGTNFIVFWPTAATNYVLQSTISLASPNWQAVVNPAPVAINNTNFVTYTNNSPTRFFRLSLNTNTVSSYAGMVLIPAGTFTMGDVTDTNINGDAAPVSVTLSAYYMDTNLVSFTLWQSVYNWGTNAGYSFVNGGADKGPNHPVQTIDWYDTVKWCNARSQQAGLTPVYYTDAGFTQVYTNGETDAVFANWSANGYRLPTEAEWEKAARGGLSGQRFPLGNIISESQANYFGDPASSGGYFYDAGPYYYNGAFDSGAQPFTSPVGSFPPNGYGLFDMAGNAIEWCWDWYGAPYAGGADPHGPSSGSNRVSRGGDWSDDASVTRCANRGPYSNNAFFSPANAFNWFGFRCVRGH